ncbi:MBL fold metallo-hydrolase [Halanaerobium saccharolyticum]|uniref:MBL fold metallo-hydrolase n=1 Tax=Halanaerobium saccharolyticum TaxID=43595 RepID=UPI003FCE6159
MKYKIHPLWWPALALASPVILPYLYYKNESYKLCIDNIGRINQQRIAEAENLALNKIEDFSLTAVVEAKSDQDFKTEAGISYFLETDNSNLLFDIAFSGESKAFAENFKKLGLAEKNFDQLVISHLHPDHMGGVKASRKNEFTLSPVIEDKISNIYLPAPAETGSKKRTITYAPQLIKNDIAATGPLRANLFFSGPTEEQALVVNLKNKGAVVILGCGHPDLRTTLKMAEKITGENIYAVAGGLHLPLKNGRLQKAGFDFQRIVGTGLRPWKKLDDNYLNQKISVLKDFHVKKVFLSPHDSSNYSIDYLKKNLAAEVITIKSGGSYQF